MDWDRIMKLHDEMAKFCPVCAKDLVVRHDKTIGRGSWKTIVDGKYCPDGHGEMGFDGGDGRGPRMEFTLNEKSWDDEE